MPFITDRETGRPSGLSTRTGSRFAKAPVILPGVSASPAISSPISPRIVQSSHRHRLVGVSPVGNSRNTRMNGESSGAMTHRSTHAAAAPNGKEPGCRTRASVA
jgi:hypothetical protein